MEPFKLPDDFMLGTATASLQIEGGDRNNSWYRWAEQGHIKDGSHCVVACDHWNRVDEDIALMKDLNSHTYRMSIEWSRIEPEKGKFDAGAMAHYRQEIGRLRGAGIVPLVTLHHFSNPLWFEDQGAWSNPESVNLFERYAEYVVKNLADLVSDWVTINEPNVYAYSGYVLGEWPPGKSAIGEYLRVSRNMILAHIRAYRQIHEVRSKMGCGATMVGVAHHIRILDPKHGTWLERLIARLADHLFHEVFVVGMSEGRLLPPVGRGYPLGRGRYSDYLGVNYYSREMVSLCRNPAMLFVKLDRNEGAPVNDLGWEIYPEGLYRVCRRYWERYRIPIWITENGTCDASDAIRARFIYDHLWQVKKLIDDGVQVQRYYHWTLMDNFEWLEGFSARFGLYETDFETQKRTLRPSGRFYAQLSQYRAVTAEMLDFLGHGG